MGAANVTFLGPQRHDPDVRKETDALTAGASVAVVTAGWEEREGEDEELAEHVGRECVDLAVFARCEQVFTEDRDLLGAWQELRDRRRSLQQLYRLRLEAAMDTVYALLERDGDPELIAPEIDDALGAVADLDHHYLLRADEALDAFEELWKPGRRRAVAAARDAVAQDLADCKALLVAGGHVGILIGRLRLLDVASQIGDRPVIAWSAGAMALSERIVLFHDDPPQGRGHAEVAQRGLGLAPGVVALPHASRRLMLDDPHRVSVLARRCAPSRCLALDPGCRAHWNGSVWEIAPGTPLLMSSGALETVTP